MPKWGLSHKQIEAKPWDLPVRLLKSSKVVTNSVQEDVYLTKLEQLVVDSPPMQRLRRVRQLGNSHLVYPDGVHTRFSHVLGALRVAQDLLDAVLDQRSRPHPQPDLFQEWELTMTEAEYTRQTAEVIVLARLGALLHDLCHVPFGHTIEDDLGLVPRHDGNRERFEAFWSQLRPEVLEAIGARLKAQLEPLILSKEDPRVKPIYPFVEDLVGNTICADLLDYLPRDHKQVGLPIALGHRFIENMYVTPSTQPSVERREHVVVQMVRNGQLRTDVESELLKYLRYRYEETERILAHHAKLAADAMIGKLLTLWRDDAWTAAAATLLGPLPVAAERDIDELRRWIDFDAKVQEGLVPATDDGTPQSDVIAYLDRQAQAVLETGLRRHGDDGLLERLRDESELATHQSGVQNPPADGLAALDPGGGRRGAMAALATDVLNRRLYKRIGTSPISAVKKQAERIWAEFGDSDARRRLEVKAANYVDLDERWHLVVWLPHPEMKLKPADVLVGLDDEVEPLHAHSERCQQIYDSHKDLWAVSVFAHTGLAMDPLRRDVLLAYIRELLRLPSWQNHPFSLDKETIALDHFAREHDLKDSIKRRLMQGARGLNNKNDTLADLMHTFEVLRLATVDT